MQTGHQTLLVPQAITKSNIVARLRRLGLCAGDVVLAHTALSTFGKVRGGADTVIDALLDVLGDEGTLVMPTFGNAGDVFDAKRSATMLGAINEAFRKRPNVVRSLHPKSSVAACGQHADAIVRDHHKADTAHGDDTPYTRVADLNGYVMLMGVDQDRNTTLHTVESLAKGAYLKTVSGATRVAGKRVNVKAKYFPGPHRDFIGFERYLRDEGAIRYATVGSCVIRLMRSRDLIDIGLREMEKNPAPFLTDNPAREDGVWQRAKLLRARWARECFTVSAASHMAGVYVEEMVDALHAQGIDHVELGLVKGTPFCRHEPAYQKKVVRELRGGKIQVSAIWACELAGGVDRAIEAAVAARAGALILPLTLSNVMIAPSRPPVRVLFRNVATPSDAVMQILEKSPYGQSVLALDPAELARVGESPFLTSYHRKRFRHTIAQMYVNDATEDGVARPLNRGNAEIKELVSILRCRSFDGTMTLEGPADRSMTLFDVGDQFRQVLDEV